MLIDGATFPNPTGRVDYTPQIEQEAWISGGATVYAWDAHQHVIARIAFEIRTMSQSQASTLYDKYVNVARLHLNPIPIQLSGEVSTRTVHFWMGNRGLKISKTRNGVHSARFLFLQVGGLAGMPA